MQARAIRRAVVAAMTMTILATLAAFADTVPADGDSLTTGNQAFIDLGSASPGQVVTWPVDFRLTCGGLSHTAVNRIIRELEEGAAMNVRETCSQHQTRYCWPGNLPGSA